MAKAAQLDRAADLLRQCDAVLTPVADGFRVAMPNQENESSLWVLRSVERCGHHFVLLDRDQPGRWTEHRAERRSVFVASSRLPQKLDQIPRFFDGLLTMAVQLNAQSDVLLTGQGVACEAMIRRVSQLFGVRSCELVPVECSVGKVSQALENLPSQVCDHDLNRQTIVFDLDNLGTDATLMLLADHVTVLSMRKNGNLHSAAKLRLTAKGSTRVLLDKDLTTEKLQGELLHAGAAGWFLYGADANDAVQASGIGGHISAASSEILKLSNFQSRPQGDTFLLHWTRRRVGPWPDQSSDEFLDDLIFRSSRHRHGKTDVLRRILATQRLLADNVLTRAAPVVCFSDIAIGELKERRVFRSHLSRWDFEPIGVAIRKDWIVSRGGRAVRYGSESDWESLDEADLSFFQLASSGNGKIDWTQEREWRVRGDVDLRTVPSDAAFAFVPSQSDALIIAEFCRWPIVVMDE